MEISALTTQEWPYFDGPATSTVALDIWQILTARRGWLFAHVAAMLFYAAFEPSLAWAAKNAAYAVQRAAGAWETCSVSILWPYILIGAAGLVLKFAEQTARKLYEATVVFALQRRLMERHTGLGVTDHVTRMVYDCLEAKKALSPFFTTLWRGIFKLVSVLCWQMALAPAWFPVLCLSVLPSLAVPWLLAPRIQRAKRRVLELNSELTACAERGLGHELLLRQRQLFGGFVRLECNNGILDSVLDSGEWIMFALVVMAARLLRLPVLPERIEMGDLAASLVALGLLNKPLREIAKAYATFRGNWPALVRTLYPVPPARLRGPDRVSSMKGRGGFTVIEMMAVLAVIGLLVGLLAPTLASMHRQGRCARCLTNLRNIYAGYVLYAAEHDGMLPPKYEIKKRTLSAKDIAEGRVLNTVTNGIQTVLAPYVGDEKVFRCPADSGDAEDPRPLWQRRGESYEVKGVLKKDLGTSKAHFCNKGSEIIASDPFKPWEAADPRTVADKIAKGEHGPKDWHEGVTHIVLPNGRAVGVRTKEEEQREQNKL